MKEIIELIAAAWTGKHGIDEPSSYTTDHSIREVLLRLKEWEQSLEDKN